MDYLFHTDRLQVRRFSLDDAQCLYQYHLDEAVKKWFPNEAYADLEETIDAIQFYMDCVNKKNLPYVLAVELTESGVLIGDTGVNQVEGKPSEFEIGYVIRNGYRGNGYAAELVEGMGQFLKSYFGMDIVYGRVIRGNNASAKVLEKCGFSLCCVESGAEDDPYGNGILVYRKELHNSCLYHNQGM